VSSLDFNDPNLVNNATTATTPIVQMSCPVAGTVQASQSWQGVHVELQGDCDLDRRTGNVYLHHAKLTVTVDGGPPIVQAKQDGKRNDFKQVAITGADDAIITGVSGGIPFIVNLHDGGNGNHGDTVRVRYGSLDTGVLSTKHGEVHIRRD
jgi:hypothetical protein